MCEKELLRNFNVTLPLIKAAKLILCLSRRSTRKWISIVWPLATERAHPGERWHITKIVFKCILCKLWYVQCSRLINTHGARIFFFVVWRARFIALFISILKFIRDFYRGIIALIFSLLSLSLRTRECVYTWRLASVICGKLAGTFFENFPNWIR